MQCVKCQTEIKEGCLFCHNCGEAVQMVPDYEPEFDDLQIKIASAQTKLPNKPTVKQLEEKTEKGIKILKKFNWKILITILIILLGIVTFGISYGSVLEKQEPNALKETEIPEAVVETAEVNNPEFNLPSGKYSFYINISLSAEPGNTIYYTLNGDTPDENSYRYTDLIRIPEGKTIVRAFAMDANGNSSEIVSEVYEVEFGAPDRPTIIPESGEYVGEQYVRILVPEDCVAYYTLDGSFPTESSEIYTGEFLMPEGTTTVSAIVKDEKGISSEISFVKYTRIDTDEDAY